MLPVWDDGSPALVAASGEALDGRRAHREDGRYRNEHPVLLKDPEAYVQYDSMQVRACFLFFLKKKREREEALEKTEKKGSFLCRSNWVFLLTNFRAAQQNGATVLAPNLNYTYKRLVSAGL